MKILCISDWHGHDVALPEVDVDLVVVLGDMHWRQVAKLDRQFDCPKLGLLGNHDRWDTYNRTNFIDLHKQVVTINGHTFAGFNGAPRYNAKDTPQYEDSECRDFCEEIPAVDCFFAHSNPMLDENVDKTDSHRGFLAFSEYIVNKQPRFFIHGHLHDPTEETFDGTTIICVYPYKVLTI